ncbi:MAG TPA: ACP S-malonyltransferase [Candidatus Limnocylindrales bacterium]|nr:ACP S-malonyltransferase [Candidatus Limnocylindrales bacterium]
MVGTAFLFPGQGSQSVGMGRALAERYPEARAVFEEADMVLGIKLSALCFKGPEEELVKTENTQPALLATSIAAYRVLQAKGVAPSAAAGHSAGEYAAHVAAGTFPFADGLRLIRARGEAMALAGRERPGAMAAVLGLDQAQIGEVLQAVGAPDDLAAANYNSPGQVVLSGTPEALALGVEEAKRRGAKKVVPLSVSAAFHSPLMAAAARSLAAALDQVAFARGRFPVYANVSAAPVREPEEARASLKAQLLKPVLWEQTMRALLRDGADRFVEVGNGRVLRGLVRGVDKGAALFGSQDPDELEAAAASPAPASAAARVKS